MPTHLTIHPPNLTVDITVDPPTPFPFQDVITPSDKRGLDTLFAVQGPIQDSHPEALTPCGTRPRQIECGTYIVFAVSKGAILRAFPDAADQVEPHSFRRYVGLVTGSHVHVAEGVEELTVNYVSSVMTGVPEVDNHCMPISSAISMTDEEEAYPLKVEGNSPFPWANCVQWTTLGCRLVVVECHRSSNIFKLEGSDLGRLQMRRGTQYSDVMSKLESLGASESAPEQQIKALMVPERAMPAEVWLDIEENVSDDAWEQAFSFSAESDWVKE